MPPTSDTITAADATAHLKHYPSLIEKFYTAKIKDPKKAAEALKRDRWRYDELPALVSGSRADNAHKPMTLAQLETLVHFKITHGHSRPFLPAMVRKNTTSQVEDLTLAAAQQLVELESAASAAKALGVTMAALDTVSKLSGVGPATASLILSVYAPETVPFFADELYAWCCPGKAGAKLKYDRKEYAELFNGVWDVRRRMGLAVSAVELEKVSFVLGHRDLLGEEDRTTAGVASELPGEHKEVDSKKAKGMGKEAKSAGAKDNARKRVGATGGQRKSKRLKT